MVRNCWIAYFEITNHITHEYHIKHSSDVIGQLKVCEPRIVKTAYNFPIGHGPGPYYFGFLFFMIPDAIRDCKNNVFL